MLSSALTVVGIFCLMLVISPILTLVTLVLLSTDVLECPGGCS